MLTRLKVVNFAVAESVELDLPGGFVAFTGETGAGKSILLEALGFLLGGRGSAAWLRAGAQRLEVEGTFALQDIPADLRRGLDLPGGPTTTARRELDATGRTRAWIGGRPCPIASLARLGESFADFHAQHDQQALLRASFQLDLLDRFAGLEDRRSRVAAAHARWASLSARLSAEQMSEEERRRRVELLGLQLEEIDAVKPRLGEEEELEESLPRLKNAERLRTWADQAGSLLDAEEDAVLPLLAKVERALGELAKNDPTSETLRAELAAAREAISSVATGLSEYRSRLVADPAALDALLSRQEALFRLKKRYGATVADVLDARARLVSEVEALDGSDQRREASERELKAATLELTESCAALHDERTAASRKLDAAVLKELRRLGLPHARFVCAVEMEEGRWTSTGADTVDFLLAPNPGEPPRALKTAASGGELSRVMLAVKTVFAAVDRTPLLVFDEVDSGVGGEVAGEIGERLSALGKGRQVFCVTHLPQVACLADVHFHVGKDVSGGRTRVKVAKLTGDERLDAVARMLGGRATTPASRRHAKELLEKTTS